jgi:ribose/xylose/arabinose/galactoside ABC-type transport system permease subunit
MGVGVVTAPLFFRRLLRRPWSGPLVGLVVVYVLFAVASPDTFLGVANLVTMVRQTVVVAIAAVGMTLVIVHGGIDLSVGSAVALTTVVLADRLRAGWPVAGAIVVAVLVPMLSGALVGTIVARARVTPFIVTLASMSVLRGTAKGFAHEQKIDADPHGLDRLLAPVIPGHVPPLFPAGVYFSMLLALLAAFVLRYTVFGRHVFAVGSNERTARLCGVNVSAVRICVYTIAGGLAGLAGVMEFSTLTVGDPTDSIGLELDVIAAVVIGGGSLAGGEGSIAGSLVGALLMTMIKTGATHVGLATWVQEILAGAIILTAVGLDRVRRQRRAG